MIATASEVPGAEPARTFEEAKRMRRLPLPTWMVASVAAPIGHAIGWQVIPLGWRDELVYHRQRTDHREDMFHTVGHLAAGVMLTSFMRLRMAPVR